MKYHSDYIAMIEANYEAIYRFCYANLQYNSEAAKDCTQEVFLVLMQKQESLDLTRPILPWLYETAKRVMMQYRRKHPALESLDTVRDIPDERAEAAKDLIDLQSVLSAEEYSLLYEYYNTPVHNKKALAEQYGLSLSQLYNKIWRIKNKVKEQAQ